MAEVYCYTENECPGCPAAYLGEYADIVVPLISQGIEASTPIGSPGLNESVMKVRVVKKIAAITRTISPEAFFRVGDAINRHVVGQCVELYNLSKGEING